MLRRTSRRMESRPSSQEQSQHFLQVLSSPRSGKRSPLADRVESHRAQHHCDMHGASYFKIVADTKAVRLHLASRGFRWEAQAVPLAIRSIIVLWAWYRRLHKAINFLHCESGHQNHKYRTAVLPLPDIHQAPLQSTGSISQH